MNLEGILLDFTVNKEGENISLYFTQESICIDQGQYEENPLRYFQHEFSPSRQQFFIFSWLACTQCLEFPIFDEWT